MMLKDLLVGDMICFSDNIMDWKEAVKFAADPLLRYNYVTENYVDKMVKNVEKYGPYIHITDCLALPHARPEDGAIKNGISLLVLSHPTMLLDNPDHSIQVFLCLACGNATVHIDIMAELTEFLTVSGNIKQLCSCKCKEDVLNMIFQIHNR